MPDVHVTVNSHAELRRKLDAFVELFGMPKKITISPPKGKGFIALLGGDDIWATVPVMSVDRRIQIIVDGRVETARIDWSNNQGLGLGIYG